MRRTGKSKSLHGFVVNDHADKHLKGLQMPPFFPSFYSVSSAHHSARRESVERNHYRMPSNPDTKLWDEHQPPRNTRMKPEEVPLMRPQIRNKTVVDSYESFSTASLMRRQASLSLSSDVAYDRRMQSSSPKALPCTVDTLASSRM